MPDLLGGHVAVHFGSTTVVPHAKSQKLIPLGVTGAQRSGALPQVPTIAEAGIAGFEVTSWNALFAPAGTAEAIVNRLNGLVKQAMEKPDARAVMEAQGLDVSTGTPAELGALVNAELIKWAKVIKAAGIKPE